MGDTRIWGPVEIRYGVGVCEFVALGFGVCVTILIVRGEGISNSNMVNSPVVEHWAASLPLPQMIASMIPPGTDEMPFEGLIQISETDVDLLCAQLLPSLKEMLLSSRDELVKSMEALERSRSVHENGGSSKFECFKLTKGHNCGTIHEFLQGLGHRVGHPIHDIMQGMQAEHCKRKDSHALFTSPNYQIETSADQEWRIVTDCEVGGKFAGGPHNRRIRGLQHLMQLPVTTLAKLTEPEVVAIVLYTGPMYVKYNTVLRRAPKDLFDSLRDNMYTNTIHALVSGVMKLQRVEELPQGLTLFRGLGRGHLDENFFVSDQFGSKGMMEFAFMSTTKNREVALQYSGASQGNTFPTVLSMECGTVDRAASIQPFSQFPGEEEYLWVPMSYIEPTGRQTLQVTQHGVVSVVHVRTNANLKCFTVEELQSRRKELHVAMLSHSLMETKNELAQAIHQPLFADVAPDPAFQKHVASIEHACDAVLAKHAQREPAWYLDDDRYRDAVGEALEFSGMARDWLELWVVDATFADDSQWFPYTLRDAHRRRMKGRKKECLAASGAGQQARALGICKRLGFVLEHLGETNELGETPLMRAAAEGHSEQIKLLLLAGADINERENATGSGYTPLVQAAYGGHELATRVLLEGGADVDKQCIGDPDVEQGWTALHFAVYHAQSLPVVSLLLRANADVAVETAGGASALGFAEHSEKGCVEIAALLRAAQGVR